MAANTPTAIASPATLTDASLLRRFRLGSEEAAAALYERYADRLHRLVAEHTGSDLRARFDAEDIVQSVFRRFFSGAKRGLYDAPDHDGLWRLFLVIALNRLRDQAAFHRSARRDVRLTQTDDAVEQQAAPDTSPAFLRLVVEEALEALAPALREVVEMRLAGFEVLEVARHTGRSLRSVERLLQQSRQQLTDVLDL
jgi:RNA polymerase sigma-70 factor (ECF subfamily)